MYGCMVVKADIFLYHNHSLTFHLFLFLFLPPPSLFHPSIQGSHSPPSPLKAFAKTTSRNTTCRQLTHKVGFFTHKRTLTHIHTHSHSHTFTLTHIHTHSHSRAHSHTHTHVITYLHTLSLLTSWPTHCPVLFSGHITLPLT